MLKEMDPTGDMDHGGDAQNGIQKARNQEEHDQSTNSNSARDHTADRSPDNHRLGHAKTRRQPDH